MFLIAYIQSDLRKTDWKVVSKKGDCGGKKQTNRDCDKVLPVQIKYFKGFFERNIQQLLIIFSAVGSLQSSVPRTNLVKNEGL